MLVSDAAAATMCQYRVTLTAVLSLLIAARVVSSSLVTNAFWDRQQVELSQGSDVTMTCTVVGVSQYDEIRVVHSHGAKTLLVSDNDRLSSTFSQLGRYTVEHRYSADNMTASVSVHINGADGGDSGIMACQKHEDDEYIAYVDIVVYTPVDKLYITSVSATGEQLQVANGNDINLQQFESYGIGCVAVHNGSKFEPRLVVSLDDIDVTDTFNSSSRSEVLSDASGLTLYHVQVDLFLVDSQPDPQLNGKLLKCVAKQQKFDDVEVTAYIVVQYEPVLSCPEHDLSVNLGANVTVTCSVKANPGSRIMWSVDNDSGGDTYDVNSDASVRFFDRAVSADETQVSIQFVNIAQRHSQTYLLRADNVIGSTFTLVGIVVVTPSGSADDDGLDTMAKLDVIVATPSGSADDQDVSRLLQGDEGIVHVVDIQSTTLMPSTSLVPPSDTDDNDDDKHVDRLQGDEAVIDVIVAHTTLAVISSREHFSSVQPIKPTTELSYKELSQNVRGSAHSASSRQHQCCGVPIQLTIVVLVAGLIFDRTIYGYHKLIY
jgi:hypothetical protein